MAEISNNVRGMWGSSMVAPAFEGWQWANCASLARLPSMVAPAFEGWQWDECVAVMSNEVTVAPAFEGWQWAIWLQAARMSRTDR
jgi:hypothetical protein